MDELPCYCINLDDRPERWEETKAAFEGTDIVPRRFSGIRHTEGWRGCGASHVAVARDAMRRGLPWILVLEDDCDPVADFTERWPIVKEALWAERDSWDIFLGGPTFIQGPAEALGPLTRIEGAYALHFYVLRASAYEKALAWNPDRHGPIDVYYSDQFRIVTTQPLLAVQRRSVSDNEEEEVDYGYLFRRSEHVLQQLLYSARTREGSVGLLFLSAMILAFIWWKKGRRY
jgi:hypothetical protein